MKRASPISDSSPMSPSTTTTTRNRISLSTGVGGRQSPLAWIGSIILHGAIVAATLFTFTHPLEITDQSPPSIPVDLVTIGKTTNIKPMGKAAPKLQEKQIDQNKQLPNRKGPTQLPQQQAKAEAAPPPPDQSAEPLPKTPP